MLAFFGIKREVRTRHHYSKLISICIEKTITNFCALLKREG